MLDFKIRLRFLGLFLTCLVRNSSKVSMKNDMLDFNVIKFFGINTRSGKVLRLEYLKHLLKDREIKMVRSEGGGEYKSNEFKRHYEELGLQHNITCPYTPQHNEVAERKNRTILDMTRSMLKAKGMSNYFWVEAVTCAIYLINISPTRSVANTTPIEA